MSTPSSVAVVTGSNKGIGFEILRKIAPKVGVAVLATRNEELGKAAAAQLKEQGLSNVVFRPLDLASSESITRFAEGIKSEFGQCSILVNNGAIAFKGRDPTPFRDQAEPTLKVNFWGTMELTEKMLPLIRSSPNGRIVNVASQSGYLRILNTDPSKQREFSSSQLTRERLVSLMKEFEADVKAGRHAERGWPNTCYGMSKLGVIAYTKLLAREEHDTAKADGRDPVFVACCCPGYCATDMSSHGGPRSAEQGARTPAWLALGGGDTPGGFYYDEAELQW